ncbi:sensor histidine kinase [Psychrobacillus psychrodurans]|uniref:sensor histidine kinase n=1 Tax=Psychrobacillus psychrodurans TaxID=126157 RepID=UPI0008EDE74B|nr:HAMP domain-containing histidine kinase [Psychrobacillus psychrodurans]SFM74944.1 Signal transduction histidine kinase [Psychrobacillus psychrodurans]
MKKPIIKDLLVSLLAVMIILAFFTLIRDGGNYIGKTYFDSDGFNEEVSNFESSVVSLVLAVPEIEEVKKNITVTEEEIEEYRYRFGSLQEQLDSIIYQYEARTDDESIAERNKKMEDITKNFEDNVYVRDKVIIEKEKQVDEYFRGLERSKNEFLNFNGGFIYSLTNKETGEEFSNGDMDSKLAYKKEYSSKSNFLRENVVNEYIENSGYVEELIAYSFPQFEGTIAISEASIMNGDRAESYQYFKKEERLFFGILILGTLAAIAFIFIWRKNKSHFQNEDGKYWYRSLPVDVQWVLFFITIYIVFTATNELRNGIIHYGGYDIPIFTLIIALLSTAFAFYQWIWIEKVYGNIEWKKSLVYRWFKSLEGFFLKRTIGVQTLIMLVVIFFWGFGTLLSVVMPIAFIVWVPATMFIGIPVLVFLLSRMSYLNRIIVKTEEMARGVIGNEIEVRGKSPITEHAANLNGLRERIKSSHSEQAKSERLKTELITNVSHDLRTPLTSIITYTDLLKNPSITDEERASYIAILDKKSMRLKTLIEDLFEVSKMATGNIELDKRKVDLTQLLQQAIAEHQEDINKSGLEYRVAIGTKPIMSYVDGQKWWRVLDNLIINTLKYAMPNTRVYINLDQIDGEAVFVIKNIAKYELGNDVNELTERFKRADTSRHTEGSGLGLAIAQSIVDLHGGSLRMDVDGDLFKVTVIIAVI